MKLYRNVWLFLCLCMAGILSACTSSGPTASSRALQPMANESSVHADASAAVASKAVANDGRLGTQWGESIVSNSTQIKATRRTSQPIDQAVVSYSAGVSTGQRVTEIMLADGRVGLSVLDGNNRKMALNRYGNGYRLQGVEGERYQLHYLSYSRDKTYEVIASVDGVNVLTGRPASVRLPGYVLRPGQRLAIEGFRKNQSEVAAFRFSAPKDSYAANSEKNSINNTGVIGSAIYEIVLPGEVVKPKPINTPQAFPRDSGYAQPPRY